MELSVKPPCFWACLPWLLLWPGAIAAAAGGLPLPISLPQAVIRAGQEDLRSRELAAQGGALSARGRRALAPNDPSLGLVYDGPGSALGPAGSTAFQVSQSLGFPGKAWARARDLSLQARVLDAEQSTEALENRREVVDAYAGLWFYRRALAVNRLRQDTFKTIVALARRRRVPNTTREVDYLRAKAFQRQADDETADLRAGMEREQAVLDSLMGLDLETPLAPEAPPDGPPPSLEAAGLEQALRRASPELVAGRLGLEADRARLRIARLAGLPDFGLSAAASQGQVAGGLSLTLPLWYGFNEAQGVRAAAQAVLAGRARVAALERRMDLLVQERRIRLLALRSKLENGHAHLIPLDEKAYRVALARYPYGQVDYKSLESAANAWLDAQVRQEQLHLDQRRALAGLEFLLGGSLP